MEERRIVSIDLGTSKVALAMTRLDGHNVEMEYYRETPSAGVSRGAVTNVKKASEAIAEAIRQAEECTGQTITGAVVNMPKYAVTRKGLVSRMERDGNTCVEEGEIAMLRTNAVNDCEAEIDEHECVYEAVAQSYSDEEDFQIPEEEAVGRTSTSLEGNFHLYVGRRKSISDIDQAFTLAGRSCGMKFFPAIAGAESVLSPDEKENGVALVDIGAGATSVSIWKDGIMRWYDSIPFGGALVTRDIQKICRIGEKLAENIKKAYGVCMPERLYSLSDKVLKIQGDRQNPSCELPVKFLSKIVTARMKEIVEAVLYMIQESGYADSINSGIVLTGGGSRIGQCTFLVKEMSGLNVRQGMSRILFTQVGMCDGVMETPATLAVGMMLSARQRGYANCAIPADPRATETATAEPQPQPDEEPEETVFSTEPEKTETQEQEKTVKEKKTEKEKKQRHFWNPLLHPGEKDPGNEEEEEVRETPKKQEPAPQKPKEKESRLGRLFDSLLEDEDEI